MWSKWFKKQFVKIKHNSTERLYPKWNRMLSGKKGNGTNHSKDIDEPDDIKLQRSYGILKQIQIAMERIFTRPYIHEEVQTLLDVKIVENQNDGYHLIFSLTHPLLRKYKFDIYDFYRGAKIAVPSILEAICSKEFYNFSNNLQFECEDATFLSENCHPEQYAKFIQWNYIEETFNRNNYRIKSNDINFVYLSVGSVTCGVIRDSKDRISMISLVQRLSHYSTSIESHRLNYISLLNSMKMNEMNEMENKGKHSDKDKNEKTVDEKTIEKWTEKYFPLDSVLASVTMPFVAVHTVDIIRNDDDNHNSDKKDKIKKVSFFLRGEFVFHGCISNQISQEWKVRSLRLFQPPRIIVK